MAADNDKWPFPEDNPKASSVSIGMASDRPIDISRFLLARGPRSAKLNNDASHLAYISDVTGRKQVWVMSTRGGQSQQLTFGNGVNSYYWHPDGKQILYSADNNGDERPAYYLITTDGRTEKVVLSHSNAYRSFGAFDIDGKRFSYASTERNGRDFDLYLYDFETQTSKMIYQAEFGFYPSSWQPNTNQLLMTEVRGEDANNLYLLNSDNREAKVIFKPDISADINSFSWSKSGSGFYFSSNINTEMNKVMYHNIKSGQTNIVAEHQLNLEKVKLCNQDKYLVWVVNDNGYDQLNVMDLASKNTQKVSLHKGVYSLSCSGNSEIMSVLVSSYYSPGTIYLVNLKSLKPTTLKTPDMAGINAHEMIEPKVINFKARDGVSFQGLLYLPTSITKGLLPPLVVDVHGGPTSQAKPNWQPLTQYLLGKGIAVLDINVRGSTGFGKTFTRLDNQTKRLDSVTDLVDAIAWLKQNGQVDADRAAVMGGSYGGYMVNAVMGAYPKVFKAGASFVGVADWVRALETASPGLKASDLIEYGDIREEKWQSFYSNNSPINTVKKIESPMFFQHGVNDPRDPVLESDSMVQALRENNVPVKYMRFADEGHSISKVSNKVLFYRELATFLEKYL
ncbi:MAG: S9 family peptidase [Thalassotalea sp.]|nr:S9 family peptidase [Thalassotalea sp.]